MTQLARSDNGYQQAQDVARDYGCADCPSRLVVRWDGAAYRAMCARFPDEHENVRSYSEAEATDVRERLERNPELSRAMVVSRDVPLTTQAIRELDNEKLMARVPDRYGSSIEVSKPMKLQLAQLARLYGLDPLWDLMIYEGQPFLRYEGRLRKLREHPDYRGHKVRPLNRAEKEEWSYEPEDLVIQCDVDMGPHGIISDWGIVRASEVKQALERAERGRDGRPTKPAPVATHRQQIAIKRAVARASKQAVGIDLPTIIESSGRVVDVQEIRRTTPPPAGDAETQARRRFWATARSGPPDGLGLTDTKVHALLGVESLSGYPGGWDQALSDLTERAAAAQEEDLPEFSSDDEEDAAPKPTDAAATDTPAAPPTAGVSEPPKIGARHPLYNGLSELIHEAAALDIPTADYQVVPPVAQLEVEQKIQRLGAEIQAERRRRIPAESETESERLL